MIDGSLAYSGLRKRGACLVSRPDSGIMELSEQLETTIIGQLAQVALKSLRAELCYLTVKPQTADLDPVHSKVFRSRGQPSSVTQIDKTNLLRRITADMMRQNQALAVPDCQHYTPETADVTTHESAQIGAALCCPINSITGDPLGAITLARAAPEPWSARDLEICENLTRALCVYLSCPDLLSTREPPKTPDHDTDFLQTWLDTIPFPTVALDRNGQIVFANHGSETLLRLPASEITQRRYDDPNWQLETLDGRPLPPEELPFARVQKEARPVHDIKFALIWPDGTRSILRASAAPAPDDVLNIAVLCIIEDITLLSEVQQALSLRDTHFKVLFNKTPASILIHDPETGDVLEANEMALYNYGVETAQQLNALWDWDNPAPYSRADALRWIRKAAQEGPQEFDWHTAHLGRARWEQVALYPVMLDSALRIYSISIDITERRRAEQALARSELRFENLIKSLPNIAIQGYDSDLKTIFWNSGSEHLYGYQAQEALGRSLSDLILPSAASLQPDFVPAPKDKAPGEHQDNQPVPASKLVLRAKDGSLRHVYSSQAYLETPSGGCELYRVDVDLTARQRSEQRLELLSQAFAFSHDGIVVADADRVIVEMNQRYCDMTGYAPEELKNRRPDFLRSGLEDEGFFEQMWDSLDRTGVWSGQYWNIHKSGRLYAVENRISTIRDAEGRITYYVSNITDITERLEYKERLERLAYYDTLTGLPNRLKIMARLQSIISEPHYKGVMGVAVIDVDAFKAINDRYGREIANIFLIELAARLRSLTPDGEDVARLGGDEFIMLFSIERGPDQKGNDGPNEDCAFLRRLKGTLQAPIEINDLSIPVSASIGVSCYTKPSKADADQLLRQADQAMYGAKALGPGQIRFFDTKLSDEVLQQNARIAELRAAVAQTQLRVYYQPQVESLSGKLLGVEALIRWQHPVKGLLPPGDFIDLLKLDESLNLDISKWVIFQVFQDLADLDDRYAIKIGCSINITLPADALLQQALLDALRTALERYPAVEPGQITIEIVEDSVIEDLEQARLSVDALRRLGVRVSLDDFGTGFSSLAYLRHLQLDEIKIDQTFVLGMLDSREDRMIVEAVIGLSNSFDIPVIAEGVETLELVELLLSLGCSKHQGFAIARPMPLAALQDWILSKTAGNCG